MSNIYFCSLLMAIPKISLSLKTQLNIFFNGIYFHLCTKSLCIIHAW